MDCKILHFNQLTNKKHKLLNINQNINHSTTPQKSKKPLGKQVVFLFKKGIYL